MSISRFAAASLLGLALAATAHAQNPNQNQPGRSGQDGGRPGGRQADPSRIVDRLMQSDADGDGKVSREEMGEGRFAAVFDQADANGDGFLTEDEISLFIQSRSSRGQRGSQAGGARRPGQAPGGQGTTPAAAAAPSGPTEAGFNKAMDRAGRALRGLRRTKFEADTFERDLMALLELEASLMDARKNVKAVPMSDAAKAKFGDDTVAYRRSFQLHMAKAMIATLNCEMAMLEGDSAKAQELVRGILENRNESHDLFEQ